MRNDSMTEPQEIHDLIVYQTQYMMLLIKVHDNVLEQLQSTWNQRGSHAECMITTYWLTDVTAKLTVSSETMTLHDLSALQKLVKSYTTRANVNYKSLKPIIGMTEATLQLVSMKVRHHSNLMTQDLQVTKQLLSRTERLHHHRKMHKEVHNLKNWFKSENNTANIPRVKHCSIKKQTRARICAFENNKSRSDLMEKLQKIIDSKNDIYGIVVLNDDYIQREKDLNSMRKVVWTPKHTNELTSGNMSVINDILNDIEHVHNDEAEMAAQQILTKQKRGDSCSLEPYEVLSHLIKKCDKNYSTLNVNDNYLTTMISYLHIEVIEHPMVRSTTTTVSGTMLHVISYYSSVR